MAGKPRKKVDAPSIDIDFEELKRFTDPFYFDGKDPEKVYYIAEDNPRRVAQLTRLGYEIVQGTNKAGETDPIYAGNNSPDTAIRWPGMVLMSTPRANAEKREAIKDALDKRNKSHVKSIMDAFKAQLREKGVPSKYLDMVGVFEGKE
jgi:hypothetical protein